MAVIFISILFGLPTSLGLVLSHQLSYLQATAIMLAISLVLPSIATVCVLAVQRLRTRLGRSNAKLQHAGPRHYR